MCSPGVCIAIETWSLKESMEKNRRMQRKMEILLVGVKLSDEIAYMTKIEDVL